MEICETIEIIKIIDIIDIIGIIHILGTITDTETIRNQLTPTLLNRQPSIEGFH